MPGGTMLKPLAVSIPHRLGRDEMLGVAVGAEFLSASDHKQGLKGIMLGTDLQWKCRC